MPVQVQKSVQPVFVCVCFPPSPVVEHKSVRLLLQAIGILSALECAMHCQQLQVCEPIRKTTGHNQTNSGGDWQLGCLLCLGLQGGRAYAAGSESSVTARKLEFDSLNQLLRPRCMVCS